MWVYKTQEEIDKDEKLRKSAAFKRMPVVVIFMLCLFIGAAKFGFLGRHDQTAKTWNEILHSVPYYLAISLIFGFLAVRKSKRKTYYVCLKCGEPKTDMSDICKCGGRFEGLSKVKWVDK
jgi:hypothetical protein